MKSNHHQPNNTFRSVMVYAINAERSVGSVCNDLFKLAQKCKDVDFFLSQCEKEESWALSKEAGPSQCDEIPTCWTQAKSDIKAAMKQGHDLSTFPSYSKMKAAKVETNRQRQAGGHPKGGGASPRPDKEPKVVRDVQEALAAGEVVDAKSTEILPADLRDLVKYLRPLPELTRKMVVNNITSIAKGHHDTYFIGLKKGEEKRGGGTLKDKFRRAAGAA